MRVVELFSCSGGLAEGFRRAGLPVTMAFDFDTDACASYHQNHGHRPVQLDVRDLLRLAEDGASLGPIDLFIADPPCTPWSRAGKRKGVADERDMLRATVQLISALEPRFWLIANVPGLDDGPNWPIVQKIIGSLSTGGYCIDFARLDAADYGVPQHRVRPFWVGHRMGTECVRWPARTHGNPVELRRAGDLFGEGLTPWVTCRQALGHLSKKDLGVPVRLRWRGEATKGGKGPRATHIDEVAHTVTCKDSAGDGNIVYQGPRNPHRPSRGDAPARTLTRNNYGDGALIEVPHHPPSEMDEPSRTVRAASGTTPDKILRVSHKHLPNVADKPSATVTTSGGASGSKVLQWPCIPPPGHKDAHWKNASGERARSSANAIKLSEKAGAILQGFPETWVFSGKTKVARWAQIGMAMPPPLAEAVARSIARMIRDAAPRVA